MANSNFKQIVYVFGVLVLALASQVSAGPYYFWDTATGSAVEIPTVPAPVEDNSGFNPLQQLQLQQQLQQQLQEEQQQQQQQQQQKQQQTQDPQQQASPSDAGPDARQKLSGHFNQFISHGSTAMKGVVDSVQPDLSNLRKDLSEVYQATRDNVGKRIEPIAQTMRPFIDQAQRVVAPYVNHAREEVPKLIQQAGPALHKVGEQMKEKIHGALESLNNHQQQAGKTIQQAGDTVAQKATDAGKTVQEQAESKLPVA